MVHELDPKEFKARMIDRHRPAFDLWRRCHEMLEDAAGGAYIAFSAKCKEGGGVTIAARRRQGGGGLKIKVVVHEAEEGGYWAEVPAIPGCATQGETMEELMANVHEAIEACLSVDVDQPESTGKDKVLEIAV